MNPASPPSPEPLRARVTQGFGLLREGRVDQAAQLRDQLRAAHEGNAEFHYYASEVCTAADELDDAHAHLVRANAAAPGQFELVLKQARVELALRRRDAFRHSATQAEQLAADDPQALWTLGRAWVACDDPVAAGRLFARARSLGCHDPALLCDLATTLLFEGRIDEAERAVEAALAAAPGMGAALHLRATLRRQSPTSNHIADIERRLAAGIAEPVAHAAALYALAKEREDIEDHAAAFAALREGAARKRGSLAGYEVGAEIATIDAIRAAWTPPAMAQMAPGHSGSGAIFIVGMPRTGTTLVERMLDRHPDVRSAGELLDFGRVLAARARAAQRTGAGADLIEASLTLDFAALGADYARGAREAARGSRYFIDKLPVNYIYCGIILAALPDAKIVHLTRAPMDCGYAVFKTLFNEAYNFSYELGELADYYACYRRLMDHWHTALAPGRILDVAYEALVNDPAAQARRIIDYCGLDWHDDVMHPEGNARPASTASSAQVRHVVHSDSVGKWRQVAEGLEPLRQRLAAHGLVQSADENG